MAVDDIIWDQNLRPIIIDKSQLRKEVIRYRMGSVKLSLGRILTKKEFETDKERILSIKLA